jgi:hypothetical protein
MKGYSIPLTSVIALALVSCAAPARKHPAEVVSATVPAQTSNTTDRNTFRSDQSAAPRINNAPIDP